MKTEFIDIFSCGRICMKIKYNYLSFILNTLKRCLGQYNEQNIPVSNDPYEQ